MASRPAQNNSAQKKKLATYGKGRGDQMRNKPQTTPSLSNTASSLYDFPDSDDSTSPPPRSHVVSTAKVLSHRSHASLTSSTAERASATPGSDDTRKRKHAKAFDASLGSKQPRPAVGRSNTSTPPVLKARPASSPKVEIRKRFEATPIDSSVSQAPSPRPRPNQQPRSTASSSTAISNRTTPRPSKPRLIDRLVAQKAESSGSGSDSDVSASEDETSRTASGHSQTPVTQRSDLPEREAWSRPTYSQAGASASKKVKHTYSQNRSIRGDIQSQDDPFGLSNDIQDDSLIPSSPPKPSLADEFDMDDDEDDDPKIAIKSVHELRRAGANNRFADEMEDLLSRIGTPTRPISSMRRNALLELAQKLQRRDFASQFRDHSARDNVAKSIGEEEDVVSSFAMVASLVIFLSSHNAPHLLRRLVEERVGRLLGRLLRISEDVDFIARQRESNLSKTNKTTVSSVKSSLLRLRIWHGYEVTALSPRSVALQLCHLLQCNLEMRYRSELRRDIEKDFVDIVEDQARRGSAEEVDFALAILVMESESGADLATLARDQIGRRASSSAHFFQRTLDGWPRTHGEIESATLKLAINTTNTEVGAQSFGGPILLASLARCISAGLRQAQEAVDNHNLEGSMYDGLLLVLGVMINILEHYPPARAALDAEPLERLADLFLANGKTVGDADSEDKSKVSVAFGYLAVILGYLCLNERGRNAMERRSQGSGISELVGSIREFIGLYRTVDSKVHELEGLAQDLRRYGR